MKKLSILSLLILSLFSNVWANECDNLKNSNPKDVNASLDGYTQCVAKQEQKHFLSKAFHFKYQNDAQMQSFVTTMLEHYYHELRQCRPGVYKYSLGTVAITTTIFGYQNNKCKVESYGLDAADILNNMSAMRSTESCEYDKAKLILFTNEAAETMTDENKYNPKIFKAVAEVNNKFCKSDV